MSTLDGPFASARDAVLGYQAGAAATVDQAWSEFPDEVYGPTLATMLAWREGDDEGLDLLRPALEARSLSGLDQQSAAHLLAAQRLADGDLWGAGQVLMALTVEIPGDLVALAVGHWIDLATGNSRMLAERPGRSIRQLDPTDPMAARARALWAFATAEQGDLERARRSAEACLLAGPDPWALHALVHVAELGNDPGAGLETLERHEWWPAADTALWWHLHGHRCRFELSAGRRSGTDTLLADRLAAASAGARRTVGDLVWRLAIDGLEVSAAARTLLAGWPDRNEDLAGCLAQLMCRVVAGDLAGAAAQVEHLEQRAESGGITTFDHMLRAVGLRAARSLVHFGQDLDDEVVEALLEVVPVANILGASTDERETWERTLVVAAGRAGRTNLERALLSERLVRRCDTAWDRARWERLGS